MGGSRQNSELSLAPAFGQLDRSIWRSVEIKLTGDLAKHYDVVYRAHVQGKGWLDWVKSGECAGTTGEALHLEAIEVKLVDK